ncbi:MAG: hypothetical protein AAF648_04255, partial [Pseudomonadota bacterium]
FRLSSFQRLHPNFGDVTPNALSPRLGDLQHLRAHYRLPGLFQSLFENFETLRLDARMLNDFPGLQRPLTAALKASGSLWIDDSLEPPGLLYPLLEALLAGHQQVIEEPGQAPLAPPVIAALIDTLHAPTATVYDTLRLTNDWYLRLAREVSELEGFDGPREAPDESLAEAIDASGDWMERDARLKDWQDELMALEGMLLDPDMLLEDDAEAGQREGLAGNVRPEGRHLDPAQTSRELERERDQLSRRIDMERAALRHALGNSTVGSRSFRYPEWDTFEQRYRPAWCTLFEQPLEPDDTTDPQALRNRVQQARNEIRARLAQIKPLGLERQGGVADGDELDFNAVLTARLDSAAGLAPDDRVYSRRDRARRDLCAAFLVDLSASTDDPVEAPAPTATDDAIDWDDPRSGATLWADDIDDTPAPETRRIIDVQREAMLAMALALEQLGDEYAIYGFSGYGRDCVEFYQGKEFGESLTARTFRRIAAMKPRRSTRMGPAIRHTVEKLKRSGHQLKLLIMLSDGFPQDCDYGPTRGDHRYGLEDTAQALAEAEAAGIRTFCLTVDRSGNDYLKQMCPAEQYLIIEEMDTLPAALAKVYRNLSQ